MAVCRALANGPRVLLADEPTGNLDPATSERVFEALTALVRETGMAALIATHNLGLAERMERVVRQERGGWFRAIRCDVDPSVPGSTRDLDPRGGAWSVEAPARGRGGGAP